MNDDIFQDLEPQEENQPTDEFTESTEEFVDPEEDVTPNNPLQDEIAPNLVEYTPVEPIKEYKPMNRGLAIFAVILSLVILLTGSCLAGYFAGKRGNKHLIGQKVTVNLASRPTEKDAMTPAKVFEEVNPSIVGIQAYDTEGNVSGASGVIYSKDGYIVTNDHIYAKIASARFKVYFSNGTECDAAYVAGDNVSDLAVLKIETGEELTPAVFGNSDEIVAGEDVVAIGRTDALDGSSISSGIVSLTSRRVTSSSSSYSARMIQTDSAINPGNSGGALVNLYGQVIGITCSKLEGEVYDRIGFAIPTKTMKRVVEQLIQKGKVTDRAKLGITYNEINSITAEINNIKNTGLYVVSVSEDSDLYGKIEKGDLITHINGEPIHTANLVLDILEDCKAGDTVTLTIETAKSGELDFDVKLRANVGQSSYSTLTPDTKQESRENTEKFDFPAGE
ncbi:MAG: trypsin-like peptidase domain-containing protein [Clostridia bacterium]|nr:trypsin-like peptidase domain-containing protein [Clostridia bacterium]